MHSLVASMAPHTKGYNKKRHQAMLNIVGVNILRARTERKLSQEKLGELAEVEKKMIVNCVHGLVNISVSMLTIIAEALEIEAHTLLVPYSDRQPLLLSLIQMWNTSGLCTKIKLLV